MAHILTAHRILSCPIQTRANTAQFVDQLELAAMSSSEVACTLAALILHDDGIPITSEKIATLVKAANIKVEAYWPGLFAKLLEHRSVDDLILSVGSGGGAAPEEAKEESDDDMGFSLFD
uniref:60S acidic ribosomal protein P1 n=1 Tax=Oryza barthii TaxID=65489 RepID=A0A0D3GVS4_9ORYZ